MAFAIPFYAIFYADEPFQLGFIDDVIASNSQNNLEPATLPQSSSNNNQEESFSLPSNEESLKQPSSEKDPSILITSKPEINISELEMKIHSLINSERQKHGHSTLDWDPTIANIARTHSEDMASRNYFSHNSPEGLRPADRGYPFGYSLCGDKSAIALQNEYDLNVQIFEAQGNTDTVLYDKIQQQYDQLTNYSDSGKLFGGLSENIGWMEGYSGLEIIAEKQVQGWMDSPGHRRNILSSYHSEGIGVFITNDGRVYATQNFC